MYFFYFIYLFFFFGRGGDKRIVMRDFGKMGAVRTVHFPVLRHRQRGLYHEYIVGNCTCFICFFLCFEVILHTKRAFFWGVGKQKGVWIVLGG